MIAKGRCQAWIMMAWSADAAIFSGAYTFNAGMEYQGQNIGTELATEELRRKLTGFRGVALTDMPNDPGEKRNLLDQRLISYPELIVKLGYDTKAIFN